MKRWIKALLGVLAFHSGWYRRRLRGRAVIVLFHRVDDRYAGDPISCTRRQFRAYLRFFRRFFEVVSLDQLLDELGRGADLGGRLVITFDDGYRDNHDVAAPMLRELGVPACFYLATGFIGTAHTPWWDAAAGIRSEWMTWDQVRVLADQGFEIGAHTVNHVDLGVVSGAEAVAEIAGSRVRLEQELGEPVRHFTYPYGRPHQITEENRDAVRDAGFASCCEAWGGDVRPGDDRYRLRRVPIALAWFVSPYHFGYEALRDLRRRGARPAPAAVT